MSESTSKTGNSISIEPVDRNNMLPLSKQIENYLRNEIANGKLSAGSKLPNVRQLSKDFGVSRSLAAYAIGKLVKDGLLVTRPRCGSFIADNNRIIHRAQTKTIGIFCDRAEHMMKKEAYYLKLYEHLSLIAPKMGYTITFIPELTESNDSLQHIRILAKEGLVDGLIYIYVEKMNRHLLDLTRKYRLPLAILDHYEPQDGLDFAVFDNTAGTMKAMEHLFALGHKKIAYVSNLIHSSSSVERLETYRLALDKNGIQYDPSLVFSTTPNSLMGQKIAPKVVKSGATAVMTFSDLLAIGICNWAMDNDVQIGKDLSVIGFGHYMVPKDFPMKLTTVQCDVEKMAERGFELLLDHIHSGQNRTRKIYIETSLKIGNTTGPTPLQIPR